MQEFLLEDFAGDSRRFNTRMNDPDVRWLAVREPL